jgi:hypothetical protein
LGLALSGAIVTPAAALESDQKETIVYQPAQVCLLTGEYIVGTKRRCFYAGCALGIDVTSDESCPSNPTALRPKTGH